MALRKHISEISFNLASQGVMILHPKNISDIERQSKETLALAEDCHIYLVVKRPRLAYVPGSIEWGGGMTRGRFSYRRNGIPTETEFRMSGEPVGVTLDISSYPHNYLYVRTDEDNVATIPAHMLSVICHEVEDESIRDLEVVYVGMSYGDGSRAAKDRLKSHSTLQRVLADMISDEPDHEALLILVQYAPPFSIIQIDGTDHSLKIEDDRDVIGALQRQAALIDRKTEIALAEAGLIKYFHPAYNDKYKNNFPDRAHTVTEALYRIDFLAFAVELNTGDINVRLFSSTRSPGYHHIANYDLHDAEVRKSFFSLLETSSSYSAENFSGPLF